MDLHATIKFNQKNPKMKLIYCINAKGVQAFLLPPCLSIIKLTRGCAPSLQGHVLCFESCPLSSLISLVVLVVIEILTKRLSML